MIIGLSVIFVDRCSHMILVAILLKLPFFLGASSNERVAIDVMYSICGTVEKTSCL